MAVEFIRSNEDGLHHDPSSLWDFGTDEDFTVACRLKRRATGAWHWIGARINAPGSDGWEIGFTASDTLQLRIGATPVAETGFTLTDTTLWHHVAVVVDRDDAIYFYLDGVPTTRVTATDSVSANGGKHLTVGRTTWGDYGDVLLEDLGIWRRALSEAEILRLYHGRMRADAVPQGLLNLWPLDVPGDGIYHTVADGDHGLRDLGSGRAPLDTQLMNGVPPWSADAPRVHRPGRVLAFPGGAGVTPVARRISLGGVVASGSRVVLVG